MGTGAADASEATDFTGALTVDGFETLNIKTNQGTNASTAALKTTEIASLIGAHLTKIALTGHSITLTDAATALATEIDGSALTGVLTVSGDLKTGSSVTGGAGNDVFTAGRNGGVTYAGGAGDDVFNAVVDGTTTANSTFSKDDTITGGSGNDTLKITATGGAYTLGAATVSGVETISLRATGSGALTVDASKISGATMIVNDRSTQALKLDNLATGVTVKIVGDGTTTNGDTRFSYAALTDAPSITLDGGVTAGNITNTDSQGGGTSNATSATITSTGAANKVGTIDLSATDGAITAVTVDAATNLTGALVAADYATAGAALIVKGAGAVNLGENGIFKTIDASANSGGVTIDVDTVATSVKGGSGNDMLSTSATSAGTAGLVDAGGGTDTLVVADIGHVNSGDRRC